MAEKIYDYVIVGAGSAGCVLANRLTEDRGVEVLILEAGGWDWDPWIHIPLGWGRILLNRMHDWMYFTEPEPNMDGRRIECARGKVIGGSSSINAMTYSRGNRGDYDRWAASGLPTWSYAHALPYFRKQESWEGGASPYRGGDGPLSTCFSTFKDSLVDDYIAAAQANGFKWNDDLNGPDNEGIGRNQNTIRNGRRCSAAIAYLRPAMERENLRVQVKALVTRVLIENGRAIGVEYRQGGDTKIARASREIILAGGVINSPQILMLSGIGDPDDLKPLGIKVNLPLKGVGKNLQDHVMVPVAYGRKEPGPIHRAMRLDRIAIELAKTYFFGTGLATDIPGGVASFARVMPDSKLPDTQLLLFGAPLSAGPYLAPFKPPFADGFGGRIIMLHPESRGRLTLASSDPATPIRIKQNFMSTDREWKTLRAGFRRFREIMGRPNMARYIASELAPGTAAQSNADIDAHIRHTAITLHHPLGTCKMGGASDETAVVDPELRVRGVERLRVVDASVMPDLISGNINAPVMMIAERAADLIRGRPTLAPVNV
ncbi:MAG TPA: GMC family oxidoreductase N-terminal domain-containing protein [Xanthobacteraceae bacterium]|nr:GMC family oxidoreductase N-terminal domain-containing protein [Xanthobacteraceae bacterium]